MERRRKRDKNTERMVAGMTQPKRERRERTDNWQLIQQWCRHPEQRLYENKSSLQQPRRSQSSRASLQKNIHKLKPCHSFLAAQAGGERVSEKRTCADEGVIFAALAAWIDPALLKLVN